MILQCSSYSVPVEEHCIAISLSVCLFVCKHISGTTGPIFMIFCAHPMGCDTLCTSGFMDDVTFGHNGPYDDAWKAEPLTY